MFVLTYTNIIAEDANEVDVYTDVELFEHESSALREMADLCEDIEVNNPHLRPVVENNKRIYINEDGLKEYVITLTETKVK